MAIDTETLSPRGWWLKVLATELHNRRAGRMGKKRYVRNGVQPSRIRPGLQLLEDYLAGDPPLREDIHSEWAAPFRQFLRVGRMNVAPKLVSSTTNRMGIRDFRTAAAEDELGDVEARKMMKRNDLKLKAREVHDDMLGLGDSYTIITPPGKKRDWSLITAESPMDCITAHDPATGETLAGLKMFRDDWDTTDFAYLFLPGKVMVAKCEVGSSTLFVGRQIFFMSDRWEWVEADEYDVPDDQVAMVRFRNKNGKSEIEGVLDTLDRINDKLFHEYWVGKLQAFKQRALEMPEEDEDLDEDDDEDTPADEDWAGIFTSAPDAMWKIPKGAKIWESTQTQLDGMLNSIKAELMWLAFTESKPLHLVTPDAANQSAEGASTMKEEHSYEIEDRRDRAEGSWAKTISLAFLFQNDKTRSDVTQIQSIWGPLERYGLQEKTTAAAAVKGVLPTEVIQTDILQYEPGDVVDRLRPLRGTDLLFQQPSAAGSRSPATRADPVAVNEAAAVATTGAWVDQSAYAASTVTTNAMQAASGAWAGFTGWYSAGAVASQAALLAQSSEAAQQAMVGIFSRYVAELTALLTDSRRIEVPAVGLQPVRNGANPVRVHSRPAYVFRETFALTGDEYEAQRQAFERAMQLVETDLMLASRQIQIDAMDELGIATYRRVLRPELSESGPCGLCVVASDRIYSVSDLLPIHGRCKCETVPIVGDVDPGKSINREDLKRIYAEAGSTNRKDLKRVRVQVNEHGELGPVLSVRGQKFTGPDELAESTAAGRDENRKRLDQLSLILGDFKSRDRAGEDLAEPIAFQQRLIADLTQRTSA